jgi:uncharacterized protein
MSESLNLITIFLTGLTTGGLTCLAVQGGLLATLLASAKSTSERYTAIVTFLVSKTIAHAVFGLFLGYVGSLFTLSPEVRGWLQIIISLYILGVALNLLNIHPLFRYFVIKPPKFAMRLARNTSQAQSIIAPAILGAITVLIPCATTQAMSVVAISSGSPIYASAIMTAFTLGTAPTFLIFGFLIAKFSSFQKVFVPLSASLLIALSAYTINGGLTLIDSPYTMQNFYQVATRSTSVSSASLAPMVDGYQQIIISVGNSGYTSDYTHLKQGIPAKLLLRTDNTQSCTRSFVIPSLKISKLLDPTGVEEIIFTPDKPGVIGFTCSMGMYSGQIIVTN